MLALIHGVKEQSFPAAQDSLPGVGTSTMLFFFLLQMHPKLLHFISNKLTALFFSPCFTFFSIRLHWILPPPPNSLCTLQIFWRLWLFEVLQYSALDHDAMNLLVCFLSMFNCFLYIFVCLLRLLLYVALIILCDLE